MTLSQSNPVRVGLVSLGCAKNLVDSEIMLGNLLEEGMEITNDADTADVLIINTCSFVESAQQESVNAILETAAAREQRTPGQGLVVAGCLPQRFRDELSGLIPEVDVFMGIDEVSRAAAVVRRALEHRARRIGKAGAGSPADAKRLTPSSRSAEPPGPQVEVRRQPDYIPDYATPRFRLTPRHFAYLKIAEGCNHPCSFCIIPRMRGPHRSRAQNDIVREAESLIADGVREINLISQDATYYGLDLRPKARRSIASPERFQAATANLPEGSATLVTLLRELNDLPGDFWIRLLYTHPAHWTDELIATIAECPKVARYVDMPLQHIHPDMLERMRRETSREYIIELIQRLRDGIPGITLRTTFIVGFPGETEEAFEELLNFTRSTRFERMGVFAYSREDGTPSSKMERQVSEKLKEQRRHRAMAIQQGISRDLCAARMGSTLVVLAENELDEEGAAEHDIHSWEHGWLRTEEGKTDRLEGPVTVARSEADAPDIDGRVYVRGRLTRGEFARVKVIGHSDYDVIAEPVS